MDTTSLIVRNGLGNNIPGIDNRRDIKFLIKVPADYNRKGEDFKNQSIMCGIAKAFGFANVDALKEVCDMYIVFDDIQREIRARITEIKHIRSVFLENLIGLNRLMTINISGTIPCVIKDEGDIKYIFDALPDDDIATIRSNLRGRCMMLNEKGKYYLPEDWTLQINGRTPLPNKTIGEILANNNIEPFLDKNGINHYPVVTLDLNCDLRKELPKHCLDVFMTGSYIYEDPNNMLTHHEQDNTKRLSGMNYTS